MKKMLSVLLALCLLVGALPAALAEALEVTAIEENDVAPEVVLEADGVLVVEDGDSQAIAPPAEAGDIPLFESVDEPDDDALLADLDADGEPEAWEDADDPQPGEGPGAAEFTDTIDSPLNSDDLFAAYVGRMFYTSTARRTMATTRAGEYLTGQDLSLYNALKPHILKVAAGEETSTQFTVPASEILGGDTFTVEEYNAMFASGWEGCNVNAWNFSLVTQALWLDCTYELYWFKRYQNDKTDDYFGISSLYYNEPLYKGQDGVYHLHNGLNYTFKFAVLERYEGAESYTVDTGLIQGAQTAAQNAKAIVEKYAGYSDYAKLFGFAYEICKLVEYNDDAVEDDWEGSQQDPWKLIWVFDGDPSTNVVCEGYSQAFQYLCELASFNSAIRCYLVTGNAGGDHAWNLVRMEDGKSYVVDVTWMDTANGLGAQTGSMADWINGEKGRLFLCGGTGSPTGGYKIYYRDGDSYTDRTYRQNDTLNVYPASVLTLAESKYILTGWLTIAGNKYYFDADRYVTGIREINGINYEFAADGRLLSSKVTGWREIDGTRYYFDSDGTMHTGWLTDGDKRYYLGEDGAMAVGWLTVDGERYLFEADGALHTVHTAVVDAGVAPTCEADGLSEGSHCAVCDVVLTAQEVLPAIGHSWGEPTYTWAADNGSVTAVRVCANDAKHIQTETVKTVATVARAATCTEKGQTTYTAAFVNEAFAKQIKTATDIPAIGHSWGEPVYTWSDDNGSVTAKRVCANDAEHVQTETVETVTSVGKAAGCEELGQTAYTAAFENEAFAKQTRLVENLPATGHSWGEPTYTWAADNGSVTAQRVCANDAEHVQTETVKTAAVVTRAATCTEKGQTTYTAAFENEAFAKQTKTATDIPATGHSWGAVSYSWGANHATATARRVCANDAGHVQTETVKSTAAVTKAATCTEKGQTTYSAKFANAAFAATTFTEANLPAKGHTPVTDKAVAPTYTETGLTKGSHCAVCGAVLVAQKVVPKLDCSFHMTKSATKKVKAGVPIQIVVDGQKVKSYKSSDTRIASVTKKGWVTTYMAGTAKITVTLKSGKKLTLTVKVSDSNAPKSIKITKGSSATLKVGKKLTLKTKLNPTKANTYLTWSTSKSKVATVTSKGVVTAKKKGTAKITVTTANGVKATIKITVK